MSMQTDAPSASEILTALRARAQGRRRRLVLEGESIAGAEYRVAAERLLGRDLEAEELAATLIEVEQLGLPAPPPAPQPRPAGASRRRRPRQRR